MPGYHAGRDEACPVGTGEGRCVSGYYAGRDEACPVGTGEGRSVPGQYGGRWGGQGNLRLIAEDLFRPTYGMRDAGVSD